MLALMRMMNRIQGKMCYLFIYFFFAAVLLRENGGDFRLDARV